MKRYRLHKLSTILVLTSVIACTSIEEPVASTQGQAFPSAGKGKFDVFGRELAGIANAYPADLSLSAQAAELASNMRLRREAGWAIVERTVEPVALLGLLEGDASGAVTLPDGTVPTVPRFQTWYGVDDIKRMFRNAFSQLSPLERLQRAPIPQSTIEASEEFNATALDRSERWPLDRFLKHVRGLGYCDEALSDEECGKSIQSNFSGATGGNSRIAYSPATALHVIDNYASLIRCLDSARTLTLDQSPPDPDANFSHCMDAEFPPDSVLLKVHWVRSDFNRAVPTYDTDAATLQSRISAGKSADWSDGDRQTQPSNEEIFTIRLKNGDTYRLAALHIMTKELRHWSWVTLWWSDSPDSDFGEDRPASLVEKNSVWANYKMNIVVDYLEGDPDPAARMSDFPSLASAIAATTVSFEGVTPTWSSNPYIEHGQGNARTNCIGCHQHGGSQIGQDLDGDGAPDAFDLNRVITDDTLFPFNGRTEIRTTFPSDYLWSTVRVDNLSQLLRSEVERADILDQDDPAVRTARILSLIPTLEDGAETFKSNCTTCHAVDGTGTPAGPNLAERVPQLSDDEIVTLLLSGRSPMPSWAHLSDQELANIRYFLRSAFVTHRDK